MELKHQTVLQGGRYVILGVLGRGGFGVTYLAEQVMAKRNISLIEQFPSRTLLCAKGQVAEVDVQTIIGEE